MRSFSRLVINRFCRLCRLCRRCRCSSNKGKTGWFFLCASLLFFLLCFYLLIWICVTGSSVHMHMYFIWVLLLNFSFVAEITWKRNTGLLSYICREREAHTHAQIHTQLPLSLLLFCCMWRWLSECACSCVRLCVSFGIGTRVQSSLLQHSRPNALGIVAGIDWIAAFYLIDTNFKRRRRLRGSRNNPTTSFN